MEFERKRKTKQPCQSCGLRPQLCICSEIPKLTLKTRVLLVIHAKELKRTTNSGRLALAALTNSSMRVRGHEALDLSPDLVDEYQSVLFFPSQKAQELNRETLSYFKKPIQLIVPDGNWRQAAKVSTRHQELSELPHFMITRPNLAQFHLRKETSAFGMSTLEAIARALGVIEGPEIEAKLLNLYKAKLNATLRGRGVSPRTSTESSSVSI